MRGARLALAAAGAAVALLCVPAVSSAAPSNRLEYGVEVSVICGEAENEYFRAGKGLFKRRGIGNIVPFLDRILDVFEETTDKVATVPAAPGDEALVASWIASLHDVARLNDKTLPVLRRAYRNLKRHDGKRTKSFRALGRHYKRIYSDALRAQELSEDLAKELTAEGCLDALAF